MSIIDDFEAIASDIARLKSDQPKQVEVTEGHAHDWADTVYGMYGQPANPPAPLEFYPHGYVEAFEAAKQMAVDASLLLSKPSFAPLVDNVPILIVTGTDQFGEPIVLKI